MEIGITTDVVDSSMYHRGVPISVKRIIKNIVRIGSNYNFHLIHFYRNSDEIYHLGLDEIIVKPYSIPSTVLSKTLANIFRAPKLLKDLDIIHFTNPFLNDFPLFFLPKTKKILTIWDMAYYLPESRAKFRERPKAWIYQSLWKLMLPRIKNKIDMYITISHGTKEGILKYLKIPEEKIRVIHLGVDDIFRPIEIEKTNDPLLPDEPFILTDKPYPALFKIYYNLKKRGIKHKLIVFSGRDYPGGKETVINLGLEKDVLFLGYVSNEELVKLYNTADLYVRFVYFTGFGIPTVEAMACGCPVVVSNADAAPEVVGDAGILLSPYNLNEWVNKIYEVLTNEELRREMAKKGIERAKMFSWKKTAEKTLKVYREVLERR